MWWLQVGTGKSLPMQWLRWLLFGLQVGGLCSVMYESSRKSTVWSKNVGFLFFFKLFDSCWALRSGGWLRGGRQEQDTGVGGWIPNEVWSEEVNRTIRSCLFFDQIIDYWDLKSPNCSYVTQNGAGCSLWIPPYLRMFCWLVEHIVVYYFKLHHTIWPDQTRTPYSTSICYYVVRSWLSSFVKYTVYACICSV